MHVAAEEALIGYLRKGRASLRDGAMFFGFDELVNAAFPRTVRHDAPGILVDDLHLAIGDDILNVASVEMKGGKPMLREFFARAPDCP